MKPRYRVDLSDPANTRQCEVCGRPYTRPDISIVDWKKRRYCSPACARTTYSAIRQEQWDTPAYRSMMVEAHRGPRPGSRKPRPSRRGEGSGSWKGEAAGYMPKHAWIARQKVYPPACEGCGRDDRKLEWSNKDHRYSRNLDDYRALCRWCHRAYDKELRRAKGN